MSATATIGPLALRPEPPVAVAVALALDAVVGEPPQTIHPVALFGRAVAPFDRPWRHPRAVGTLLAIVAPLGVAALAYWAITVAPPTVASVLAGVVLFSTVSLRRLLGAARSVIDASETDVELARENLPALVGRNPEPLSAGQVRSAAVESLAENLADGFVASLVAFVLGSQVSLSVGVAAAVWVKAINTLDSMLGYPSKPVGTASARLDDAVMWLPARVTAVLLALAASDVSALRRARRWQDAPASPNSGWPMATLAVALGTRLEKPGAYVLCEGVALPDVPTARRARRVVGIAGVIAGLGALLASSVDVVPSVTALPAAAGVIAC